MTSRGPVTGRPLSRYDVDRQSDARADLLSGLIPAGVSVLDFGAYRGAIATRLACDGRKVTAVAPELGRLPGVTTVVGLLGADEIVDLGRFDYTLALSVLHQQQDRWMDVWDALRQATVHKLFVEVPRPGEPRVPHPEGLDGFFDRYPTVGTFPGKRDGWSRDIVEVAC